MIGLFRVAVRLILVAWMFIQRCCSACFGQGCEFRAAVFLDFGFFGGRWGAGFEGSGGGGGGVSV